MSTLRISNIEAKSVPASATIDEKIKITNSSGDTLVFIDGKTSGITTVGINTTDSNITFDANSNIVVTGIITATRFSGQITPTSLEIGSNIKLGNAGVITATSFVGSGANLTSLPTQVTISNNADNRVITGGSGTNLNGESNLTFDGTNMVIGGGSAANVLDLGTATGNRGISWGGASYNYTNIWSEYSAASLWLGAGLKSNGNSTGFFSSYGSSMARSAIELESFSGGGIKFFTSGAQTVAINGAITVNERLRIQPNGDVYLNATQGSTAVTSGAIRRFNAGLDYWDGTAGSANAIKYAAHGQTDDNMYGMGISAGLLELQAQGDIGFFCGGAGAGTGRRVERFRMKSDGNLHVNDGNLVIGTSGHGIDFSATGGPLTGTGGQELLDDYEEGTWQPSGFVGGGSVSTNGATYTKIGCVVYIYFYVGSMNIPNNTSQFEIGGLPFTVTSSNDHYPPLTIGYTGSGNLPAEIRFLFRAGGTYVYSHTTAGSAASLNNQGMRGYLLNHPLLCSGFYFTDS